MSNCYNGYMVNNNNIIYGGGPRGALYWRGKDRGAVLPGVLVVGGVARNCPAGRGRLNEWMNA